MSSLADFPIGIAVAAGNESRSFLSLPEAQQTIRTHFSQLSAENIMKMSYLHPAANTYHFEHADALLTWAESNDLTVHGHTFIWHSAYQLPTWMNDYSGDFADMLDSHVSTIATHFAGQMASWDVVNEALDETELDCYRRSLFYDKLGSSYIADAFIAARTADANADLYYNDFSIEAAGNKYDCLLGLVDDLQGNSVPITGVGFQMHIQIDYPSVAQIAEAFQGIVDRGLKVKITELDIPLNNPYSSEPFPMYFSFTAEAAERQKQRYKAVVKTYMDTVPAQLRGGITVWGLWDGDSWIQNISNWEAVGGDWPLLFTGPSDGPYEAKPAFFGVVEALQGL